MKTNRSNQFISGLWASIKYFLEQQSALLLFLYMIYIAVVVPSCLTLRNCGLQYTRPLCPSPSPKVCPGPLHWWWHPAISSESLFSFCPHSFLASGTFPKSKLFTSDDQNTGVLASASVPQMSIWGWYPLRLTGLILLFEGLSGVFSSAIVWRHQFFSTLPSLWFSS